VCFPVSFFKDKLSSISVTPLLSSLPSFSKTYDFEEELNMELGIFVPPKTTPIF